MFYRRSKVDFLAIFIFIFLTSQQSTSKIVQLNVLFRHGDRTPTVLYPQLPYTKQSFYPFGVGGLTNVGKSRSYEFGTFLRKRYNDFLGRIYVPEEVQALSSNTPRTKMTLQLVLAGLYPPILEQKWNSYLNWQPIPTHYKEKSKDYIFQRRHICQMYLDKIEDILQSPKVSEKIASYQKLMTDMTFFTGKNFTQVEDLYVLYLNFVALNDMNFKLPNWTQTIFPRGQLFDAMLSNLKIQNYNEEMKRLHGGGTVRQFLENMMERVNGSADKNPKIYLYSGHDVNILSLLSALNVESIHLPQFGSSVIMELLLMDGNYYVKMWYHLGIPPKMKELVLPHCSSPCPLNKFRNLTKNVIPSDEEFKCV